MRLSAAFSLLPFLLCLSTGIFAAEKEGFVFKNNPEHQPIKTKKPVRIKLKRSAKDDYTWELAGDDVDEIIRTDKRLRKMLNVQ
ncbi:MAG: hypothetical protein HZA17_00170 [Nitrospirae bacterium]|nr:hypothetical protein [Nitrospirota bacterium]